MSNTQTPKSRSYFAATAVFRTGDDSPRKYLERCIGVIEEQEARIGAFVETNLDGARKTADEAELNFLEILSI